MKYDYDAEHFEPPAPVVPLVIAAPTDADRVEIPAVVDTGADVSLVPTHIARALALPRIDRIALRGIGQRRHLADVHGAVVRIGRIRAVVRLTAFGDEALVGRDVLALLVTTFDGPAAKLELRDPRRRRA